MKTLVVGYGNVLRSDDGVGAYVVEALAHLKLRETDVLTCHQLHIDQIETWKYYPRIVLVDAAEKGLPIEIKNVDPTEGSAETASHYATPDLLLGLLKRIYGVRPLVKICSIRGSNFEFGNELSPSVREHADEAVALIQSLIQGGNVRYA